MVLSINRDIDGLNKAELTTQLKRLKADGKKIHGKNFGATGQFVRAQE